MPILLLQVDKVPIHCIICKSWNYFPNIYFLLIKLQIHYFILELFSNYFPIRNLGKISFTQLEREPRV